MTIKVGDTLPQGRLWEFREAEGEGCPTGPQECSVADLARGRRLVIFGLPGAFTPTCSARHLPGYVENHDAFRGRGVDEIWCVSVNDAFVMSAWGREQKAGGRVRMMADGAAEWTRALGLDQDLSARGLGVRSQRYAMLVEDGVVRVLRVEAPGKFEVSGAEAMLPLVG